MIMCGGRRSDTELIPWLADHKVHGQPVMPVAASLRWRWLPAARLLGCLCGMWR